MVGINQEVSTLSLFNGVGTEGTKAGWGATPPCLVLPELRRHRTPHHPHCFPSLQQHLQPLRDEVISSTHLDTWGREVEDQAVHRRVLDSRREASVQGALQGLLAVLLYSQAVPVDLRWWAAWHRSFQVLRCTCCLVVASVPHLARRCSRSSPARGG